MKVAEGESTGLVNHSGDAVCSVPADVAFFPDFLQPIRRRAIWEWRVWRRDLLPNGKAPVSGLLFSRAAAQHDQVRFVAQAVRARANCESDIRRGGATGDGGCALSVAAPDVSASRVSHCERRYDHTVGRGPDRSFGFLQPRRDFVGNAMRFDGQHCSGGGKKKQDNFVVVAVGNLCGDVFDDEANRWSWGVDIGAGGDGDSAVQDPWLPPVH